MKTEKDMNAEIERLVREGRSPFFAALEVAARVKITGKEEEIITKYLNTHPEPQPTVNNEQKLPRIHD